MTMLSVLLWSFVVAGSIVVCLGQVSRKRNHPPGPKGLPLLGNIFQFSKTHTWRYFHELSKIYGPIVRLDLAGHAVVILSDPHDAEELLARRAQNYSSRTPLIYASKYVSNNKRMLLMPYGETLRKQRAAFHQMLQPRIVGSYDTILEMESAHLLHDVLARPEDCSQSCERFSAALVFRLTYGRRIRDEDMKSIGFIIKNMIDDAYPGTHLVDSWPILDLLPDWLALWRVEAKTKHEHDYKIYRELLQETRENANRGTVSECFASRLLEQSDKLQLGLEDLSYVSGTAFEAGTETTFSQIHFCIMALVLYPDVLKKAQAEIDSIFGCNGLSLPCMKQFDQLPYCSAIIKEVFRWAPAAASGIPHFTERDDEYKGYSIRGGSSVIPCIWNMHHNEAYYPNSYEFDPERFINITTNRLREPATMTEGHYAFGFGRRKCPGLHLATKSVWIGVVRLIWGFNIGRKFQSSPDLPGETFTTSIDPNHCTSGIIMRPADFPFEITPRSRNHEQTIEQQCLAQS